MKKKNQDQSDELTMRDIRRMISQDVRSLRSGKLQPQNFNATCNGYGKYIQTVKMEMELHRMLGSRPNALVKQLSALTVTDPLALPATTS